jgi:hypothetical protein
MVALQLTLLDNAASRDQVRPVLPAGSGCLALITSRHSLRALAARAGAEVRQHGELDHRGPRMTANVAPCGHVSASPDHAWITQTSARDKEWLRPDVKAWSEP